MIQRLLVCHCAPLGLCLNWLPLHLQCSLHGTFCIMLLNGAMLHSSKEWNPASIPLFAPPGETNAYLTPDSSMKWLWLVILFVIRNLSSVNEKTRQQMRETRGLVDSLVGYIKASLEESPNDKVSRCVNSQRNAGDLVFFLFLFSSRCLVVLFSQGLENAVCVLRNLSYQLYSEMPPSALIRLEGPTRAQDTGKVEAIGCFTPRSRKAKNVCMPTWDLVRKILCISVSDKFKSVLFISFPLTE